MHLSVHAQYGKDEVWAFSHCGDVTYACALFFPFLLMTLSQIRRK